MKKFWSSLLLIVISVIFFVSTTAFLGSTNLQLASRNPDQTPNANSQGQVRSQGAGNNRSQTQTITGFISSVAPDQITVTLDDTSSVIVLINSATQVSIPTLGNSATTANLFINQNVVVRVYTDSTQNLVAESIKVVPGKPTLFDRVGTVTDYQAGTSITISDDSGQTYTFAVNANTKILPADRASLLAVGSVVTIISPRDVTGGPLTADGIVVHPANEVASTPVGSETPEATVTVEGSGTPEVTGTVETTGTPEVSLTPETSVTPTLSALPTFTSPNAFHGIRAFLVSLFDQIFGIH